MDVKFSIKLLVDGKNPITAVAADVRALSKELSDTDKAAENFKNSLTFWLLKIKDRLKHKNYNHGEVLYTIEGEKPKDLIEGVKKWKRGRMRYPGLYPLGPWTPLPLFLLQRYNFIFNYKQMDVKNLFWLLIIKDRLKQNAEGSWVAFDEVICMQDGKIVYQKSHPFE